MKDFRNPLKVNLSRKLLATVALTALLAGCSSVPDAINPVEWYKGARDAIMGDDEKKKDTKSKSSSERSVPGANESFPKLSSVPDRPKATVAEERKRIAAGLVADREESRKYSNEVIRRQGDAANTPPPPPPPTVNLQPTPPSRPKAPVVSRAAPAPKPAPLPKPMVAQKPALAPMLRAAPKPAPKMKPVTSIQRTSPQLRVAPPSAMVKVPSVNPNSPQLAAIPGFSNSSFQYETVVVSGNGVQTIGSRRGARSGSGARTLTHGMQGSYQVATILFDNGSSTVKSRDRRVLRQVIAQHKQVGGTLRIIGHASRRTRTNDPIRHKMANFQVSTARAERIAKELVKMGVKANKLLVGSVSDSEPRYYEYMPSGEAGNRRTEIYIDF